MPHSYSQIHLHLVFSTKDRRNLISKDLQPKLWSYLVGVGTKCGMPVLAVGGVANHAHLLLQLPADVTLAKAVLLLKSNSSKWMKEHEKLFSWQEGYSAFSVSTSNLPAVIEYILTQEAHHKKLSFEDEYLALLKKHGIEFDPRFVFG
jgi:putative transposase